MGHALEVKKRIGGAHKTDTVDERGLALLLRNGTLPEVWIPPAGVRICAEWCAAGWPCGDTKTHSNAGSMRY